MKVKEGSKVSAGTPKRRGTGGGANACAQGEFMKKGGARGGKDEVGRGASLKNNTKDN